MLNWKVWLALVVIAVIALAVLAAAQVPAGWAGNVEAMQQDRAGEQRPRALQERRALAEEIILAREHEIGRGEMAPSFKAHWAEKLASLPLEQLQQIRSDMTGVDFNAVTNSLTPNAFGVVEANALGDSAADLVFTKVNPCRIIDTRIAGGPLPSGGGRDFYVAGTVGFTGQGGASGGCGVPVGATAVAVNLVVLPAGYGWLRAWPYGGAPPNASVINYRAEDIANGYIQPICDPAVTSCSLDLSVIADAAGGHVLMDVTGYFMKVNKAEYRSFTATASGGPKSVSTGVCTNLQTVTVNAPGPGQIVIRAYANTTLYHFDADSYVSFFVSSVSGTSCSLGLFSAGVESFYAAGYYHFTPSGEVVFTVSGAGTYVFYLNARSTSPTTANVFSSRTSATFQPQ